MDKETKEYLGKDLGLEPIKATTTFTPETTDGSIELLYVLDSSLMRGKTTVVFEDLLVNGITVRSHADLEDENQTVYLPVSPAPPTIVKTGDTFGWLQGVGSVILLMGIAFVLFARRKKKVN